MHAKVVRNDRGSIFAVGTIHGHHPVPSLLPLVWYANNNSISAPRGRHTAILIVFNACQGDHKYPWF